MKKFDLSVIETDVANLKTGEPLEVIRIPIANQHLEKLVRLLNSQPNITHLVLHETSLGNDSMCLLATLKYVTHLELTSNCLSSVEGLRALLLNASLNKLVLDNNLFDDAAFQLVIDNKAFGKEIKFGSNLQSDRMDFLYSTYQSVGCNPYSEEQITERLGFIAEHTRTLRLTRDLPRDLIEYRQLLAKQRARFATESSDEVLPSQDEDSAELSEMLRLINKM